MLHYGRTSHSWMEDTKRISIWDIKKVIDVLDEVYWLLEDDVEVLKEADRPLKIDHKAAKELVYQAIETMQSQWEDKGLSKIDDAASDIEYAISRISSLKIDFNLAPDNWS